MMRFNLKKVALVFSAVLLAVTLTGCKSKPVKNVDAQALPSTVTSASQVKDAIIRAGKTLGWVIKEKDAQTLKGTLSLRKHIAHITIPYSETSYSLLYRGSKNLDYDAEAMTIHSNYNGWISNLDRQIQIQLSAM